MLLPIFSKWQACWSKVSRAAREMVKVFSMTFFLLLAVGQMVKTSPPPPIGECFDASPLPPIKEILDEPTAVCCKSLQGLQQRQ